VFISHAGEQKYIWVGTLKQEFEREHPGLRPQADGRKPVFLDETSLQGGQKKPIKEIYENLVDAFVGESSNVVRSGAWDKIKLKALKYRVFSEYIHNAVHQTKLVAA
jgi:hypothetical protein